MPTLPKKSFTPSYIPEPNKVTRATGDQAFYNSWQWRNCSTQYRHKNPLCENCYQKGRLRPAQVTDHPIPIPIGEAFDERNHMSLCHTCHNQKSGMEGHAGAPLIPHLHGLPVDRNEIFKLLK